MANSLDFQWKVLIIRKIPKDPFWNFIKNWLLLGRKVNIVQSSLTGNLYHTIQKMVRFI